jgi:hypothetical protein
MTETAGRNLPGGPDEIRSSIERYAKIAMIVGACLTACGVLYFAAIFLVARG